METYIYFLTGVALISNSLIYLIGLFTVYHIFRKQKEPADTSNRINKIRLWWFAMTREDKFVELFPWLKKDEWENFN